VTLLEVRMQVLMPHFAHIVQFILRATSVCTRIWTYFRLNIDFAGC
jgi:hypothetical protein